MEPHRSHRLRDYPAWPHSLREREEATDSSLWLRLRFTTYGNRRLARGIDPQLIGQCCAWCDDGGGEAQERLREGVAGLIGGLAPDQR